MNTQQKCIEAYARHKNLKLAGQEVGIPWQTVYVHLKKAGVPVTGDKARYGSDTDRLAAKGEEYFKSWVPFADDQNKKQYQSKFDFVVSGFKVDVKSSTPKRSNKNSKTTRWAFYSKKQESIADFFVLIGFNNDQPAHVWLVPGEIARRYTTISISAFAKCRWWDYAVLPEELPDFFKQLNH
jgi:hypothetical protein